MTMEGNTTPPPGEKFPLWRRRLERYISRAEVYCQSMQGAGHPVNEDAVGFLTSPPRLMVADGISQGNRSERASKVAIELFSESRSMSDRELKERVFQADIKVRGFYEELREEKGGTTLVVAEIRRGCVASILNIGDSRAYLITRRPFSRTYTCRQVTVDQTFGELKKKAEIGTPQGYPDHVMIHAIGYGLLEAEVNITKVEIPPYAFLVLCTDGAFKTLGVDPAGELSELACRAASASMLGKAIVERAIAKGEIDDVTVAVFRPRFLAGARWPFWAALVASHGLFVIHSSWW